jgi:hypothetical protein
MRSIRATLADPARVAPSAALGQLSVETDSLAAFTDSPAKIGEVPVTATGAYELSLSGRQIETLHPNAAAIRCKATLRGTTPSITFGAFLVPPEVGRVPGGYVPARATTCRWS